MSRLNEIYVYVKKKNHGIASPVCNKLLILMTIWNELWCNDGVATKIERRNKAAGARVAGDFFSGTKIWHSFCWITYFFIWLAIVRCNYNFVDISSSKKVYSKLVLPKPDVCFLLQNEFRRRRDCIMHNSRFAEALSMLKSKTHLNFN